MSQALPALDPQAVNARLVSLLVTGAVGLGVFLSGFVLKEPAPYELYMAGLVTVAMLFGLSIPGAVAPLLALLIVFNVGGMLSLTQMDNLYSGPLYVAVSLFLALTAVFMAAVIAARPGIFPALVNAWILSALITGSAGIIGYFGLLPGSEVFTRYGRATGFFEDPNVFGPFLVFPAVYLLQRLLTGGPGTLLLALPPLLVIVLGIFLSFSRGAWGLFALASMVVVAIMFVRSRSARFRLRLTVMALVAFAMLAVAIAIALQIPAVASLFTERAQLVQDYDGSRLGRFARFGIGFLMATEHPFGIGPLNFGRIFGEDTHNIWLKSLMDYGWLGFAAFFTLIAWTFAAGFRILFRDRPWQPVLMVAYAVFAGHVALGTVIDIDHWRHFYLLMGMVWGCIALEARHQREMSRA